MMLLHHFFRAQGGRSRYGRSEPILLGSVATRHSYNDLMPPQVDSSTGTRQLQFM